MSHERHEKAPRYLKVKEHILARIASGEFGPGSRVPSENELVSRFGLSRMTVNRALRELAADGLLSRRPGVGSFVRQPPARGSLLAPRDIAQDITRRGHRHSSRLIARETLAAAEDVAESFAIEPGRPIFRLVMVHDENMVPVQLEERLVNAEQAQDFLDQDFSAITPTAWLMKNFPVEEVEHTVQAAMPGRDEQGLLGIGADEPCLILTRRSWSGGAVLTVARLTFPASRYELHSRHRVSPQGEHTP
jgi:GntR family transcriptional regulator, histidine utilization repressor